MPVSNFPEYVRGIGNVLDAVVTAGEAVLVNIQIDQRSSLRGFIAGLLQFNDSSELHYREFIDISLSEPRMMYAYHYQDANNDLIFRYDNAKHRPALPQAEHKHTPKGMEISKAPTLAQAIDGLESAY